MQESVQEIVYDLRRATRLFYGQLFETMQDPAKHACERVRFIDGQLCAPDDLVQGKLVTPHVTLRVNGLAIYEAAKGQERRITEIIMHRRLPSVIRFDMEGFHKQIPFDEAARLASWHLRIGFRGDLTLVCKTRKDKWQDASAKMHIDADTHLMRLTWDTGLGGSRDIFAGIETLCARYKRTVPLMS